SIAAIAVCLTAAAPRLFVRRVADVVHRPAYDQLLPGAASAAVLMFMLLGTRETPIQDRLLELFAAGLLVVLMIRQYVSWREENSLVRALEERVADRTE